MQRIQGWNLKEQIYIDGQNSVGKSQLSDMMNRLGIKINRLNEQITTGSKYNVKVLYSIEYMMLQLATKSSWTISDRSPYSNLIFFYVHSLIAIFANSIIPNDKSIIWGIFNNLAMRTGLQKLVDFVKFTQEVNIIFLLCSDLNVIAKSLKERGITKGSINDIFNSQFYNYQAAQYWAMLYFSELLQQPAFDIMHCYDQNILLGDFYATIASYIDIKNTVQPINCCMPNLNSSKTLLYALDECEAGEAFIIEKSNK